MPSPTLIRAAFSLLLTVSAALAADPEIGVGAGPFAGARSGIDGGNDGGKGITDTPQGLKLQCEGHDARFRHAWIKDLDLAEPNTDF